MSIGRDLTHAWRTLIKARGFTAICVISLGIGMGAVAALVTFNRALSSPAQGIDTANLVELLVLPQGPLRAKAGEWAVERWSYPDYRALRSADIGMDVTGWSLEFSEFGDPTPEQKTPPRVATLYVSSNYFRTFGVSLARGAGFAAEDDSPSADARVIVSHDFWKSRLNSDPDIVGKSIKVDGVLHTVVGVSPEGFRGHFHFFQAPGSLLFVPLERHPRFKQHPNLRDDRSIDWVRIHAKLQPGVDMTKARAMVSAAAAGLAAQYPSTNEFKSATVEPYLSMGAAGKPQQTQIFSVLISLAATVLFIVCLNISGMMLVRATTRARELSIRAALGATRRSLMQHLFFEAIVLAFVAGGIATLVLYGVPAIIAWRLGVPVPPVVDFDITSAAIAMGLCIVVSVLLGLLPALRFSNPDLLPALKDDAGGGGTNTIRVHRFAAMAQIAVAVPFLVVSGVMIDRVRLADFGFPVAGLAGAQVPAPKDDQQRDAGALRRVRDTLRQAPGVQSVALAAGMPIDFDYREFRVSRLDQPEFATAHVTRVGENFVETVGAKIMRGRTITTEDRLMDAKVAVISEPLAKNLFADTEAIGRRIRVAFDETREEEFEIIGVSNDFATSQLTTTRLQVMVPLPEALPAAVHLIVRGAPGDEPKLKSALETALRELGVEALPGVAFPGIVTGQDLLDKSYGDLIAEGTAVGVVGGLVLILATLGIVGVVGFMAATRTKEFAVRMALGSTRVRVFRLMLSDTVKLVIPGVVVGLVIAAVLIRTMQDVMGTPLSVGTQPLGIMEPVIYAGASAIAIAFAVLAGLPAARRATAVQPMVAIRAE